MARVIFLRICPLLGAASSEKTRQRLEQSGRHHALAMSGLRGAPLQGGRASRQWYGGFDKKGNRSNPETTILNIRSFLTGRFLLQLYRIVRNEAPFLTIL